MDINNKSWGRRQRRIKWKFQLQKGKVKTKCGYCEKYHPVGVNDFFTCPESMTSGGSYYLAIDKKGEALQTSCFENIIIFLGLEIKKA